MRRAPTALLTGLFLAALALRPQLVGIGPLVPRIQEGLGVSHAVAGLLTTIPVLCMGVFAPVAPYLLRRHGTRAAITGCVALIAVAGVGRALVPGAAGVVLLTVPIGVGMGFAGALMPVAVKERFAHRPAFATGVYATGMSVGGALSSVLAVPIAVAASGWRSSLLVYSLASGALVVAWLVCTRHEPPHRRSDVRPVRLPWRNPLAWRLVAIFFCMSTSYYGLNSWLSDAYVEHGWSEGSAGALVGVLNLTALVTTLLVPWLADRAGSRRAYLVGLGAALTLGAVLLDVVPAGAWGWATIAGLAIGALFPLVLTLPLDVGHRPAEVAAVAGMMLGVGYTLSAASPFLLGAARDATGSFTTTLSLVAASAACLLALCATLSRERLHAHALRGQPAATP